MKPQSQIVAGVPLREVEPNRYDVLYDGHRYILILTEEEIKKDGLKIALYKAVEALKNGQRGIRVGVTVEPPDDDPYTDYFCY